MATERPGAPGALGQRLDRHGSGPDHHPPLGDGREPRLEARLQAPLTHGRSGRHASAELLELLGGRRRDGAEQRAGELAGRGEHGGALRGRGVGDGLQPGPQAAVVGRAQGQRVDELLLPAAPDRPRQRAGIHAEHVGQPARRDRRPAHLPRDRADTHHPPLAHQRPALPVEDLPARLRDRGGPEPGLRVELRVHRLRRPAHAPLVAGPAQAQRRVVSPAADPRDPPLQRQHRRGGVTGLLDVTQRRFQARAVETAAVRPQRRGRHPRSVGQPGGRGIVAGAPPPDEDLCGLLGTLPAERPVHQDGPGKRNRHEGHESGYPGEHGLQGKQRPAAEWIRLAGDPAPERSTHERGCRAARVAPSDPQPRRSP